MIKKKELMIRVCMMESAVEDIEVRFKKLEKKVRDLNKEKSKDFKNK